MALELLDCAECLGCQERGDCDPHGPDLLMECLRCVLRRLPALTGQEARMAVTQPAGRSRRLRTLWKLAGASMRF